MSISSPDPVRRLLDGVAYMRLADGPPPPVQAPPPIPSTDADEELEAFRKEWRQEVQAKKHDPHPHPQSQAQAYPLVWGEPGSATSYTQPGPSGTRERTLSPGRLAAFSSASASPRQAPHAFPPLPPIPASARGQAGLSTPAIRRPRKPDDGDPVAIYAQAVEHEQSGRLNDALRLYRRAFKLDDSVDKSYARSVVRAQAAARDTAPTPTSTSADIVSPSAPAEQPYSFQRHIQLAPDYERRPLPVPNVVAAGDTPPPDSVVEGGGDGHTSLLSSLFSRHEDITSATFLPAEEDLPLPIASLPAELLDPIFAHLDVASLERFALTCWRARYVTAASEVWRRLAEGIYRAPAMVADPRAVRELGRRHGGEWRSVVVEEERVRMDGCYISVCHYVRPGAGDQWVAITHMITYHRFLRFYPDGTVISFLTTDHPSDVVPSLRPTLRAKGLHIGRWRLVRSDDPSHPAHPAHATGKHAPRARHARVVIEDLVEPPAQGFPPAKYEFCMELSLRETGRGRWNKLDILDYRSINLATAESLSLSLKHQKPFYFSKVMYYHPRF